MPDRRLLPGASQFLTLGRQRPSQSERKLRFMSCSCTPACLRRLALLASGGLLLALAAGCTCSSDSMARHFNDLAAEEESQPDRVVECLELKPGDQVADLGAGGGYFTVKLAKEVGPTGTVYAVEIEQAYLDFIQQVVNERGISNVELVLATPEKSNLPHRTVDLVFVRNVFHHIEDPATYFSNLRTALGPNGRVAVIDYTPDGLLSLLHGHHVPEEEVVTKMEQAGYSRVQRHAFLSEQSFNIFAPRPTRQP